MRSAMAASSGPTGVVRVNWLEPALATLADGDALHGVWLVKTSYAAVTLANGASAG